VNLIIKAAQFAAHAHATQKRKYHGEPFITHPMRVAGQVALVPGVTEVEVAAAWLHDVDEDCPAQRTQLRAQFAGTPKVLMYCNVLTNRSLAPEHKGKPRAERKRIDREWLASCDLWTQVIKMFDRRDNVMDMDRCTDHDYALMYCDETHELVNAIQYAAGRYQDSRCKAIEDARRDIMERITIYRRNIAARRSCY